MKTTIAVDPGTKGGYVVCIDGKTVDAYALDSLADFIDHLWEIVENGGSVEAVVEAVPPFCGKNTPSSSSFKLGKSCGEVEGALRALRIPVHLVPPKTWQKGLSGLKGLAGHPRKKVLRDHAHRLYPNLGPTLRTADAILIAHHFLTLIHQKR